MRIEKGIQFYHPVSEISDMQLDQPTSSSNTFSSEKPLLHFIKSGQRLAINFAYPLRSPEDAARLGQTYRTTNGKCFELEELKNRYIFPVDIKRIRNSMPFWVLDKKELREIIESNLEGRKVDPVSFSEIINHMQGNGVLVYDSFFKTYSRSDSSNIESKIMSLIVPIIKSKGDIISNVRDSFKAVKSSNLLEGMQYSDYHLKQRVSDLVGEYILIHDFLTIKEIEGPKIKREVVSHFENGVSGDSARREKYEFKIIDGNYRKDEKDEKSKKKNKR